MANIQDQRLRIITLALLAGIFIAFVKFFAYYLTGSNAIYTDALESLINIAAGGMAFYSIYLSARPKDENHPYGHGKVEFFAVGFEGALIVFAAVSIIYRAVHGLMFPYEIKDLLQGAMLTAVAGVANLLLGRYMLSKGKSLRSVTLEADGRHLMTDGYTSAALLAGLAIVHFTGLIIVDCIISLLLGVMILYNGYRLLRKSVSGLMAAVDPGLVESIVAILEKERKSSWIDVHNLRAQKYGADLHIDCHITMPYYFNLIEMHEEVQAVELLIERESDTRVELFIHVDPCIYQCCFYCSMPACPVRQSAKTVHIPWTAENVLRNAKHFNDHV